MLKAKTIKHFSSSPTRHDKQKTLMEHMGRTVHSLKDLHFGLPSGRIEAAVWQLLKGCTLGEWSLLSTDILRAELIPLIWGKGTKCNKCCN